MAAGQPGTAIDQVHQLDAAGKSADRAMAAARQNKHCRRCGKRKGPRQATGKYCATCQRTLNRQRARAAHGRYLERTYGITIDEYDAIKTAQGGCCYICRRASGASKRLAVDHDHNLRGREAVRGILCSTCNRLLGHLRDDPGAVARITQYLAVPPARAVLGIESGHGDTIPQPVVRRGRRVRQPRASA